MTDPDDPHPGTARGAALSRPNAAVPGSILFGDLLPSHRSRVREIVGDSHLFRPDEIEVALEVFDDYCEAPGADYHALGALEADGSLVGFGLYGATPCTQGTWDLYWLAVDPRRRGIGIGRALLGHVERRMVEEGARLSLIETSARPAYTATRRFYTSCGYQQAARVPDFYGEGDDLVIFTKRLAARGER